MNAESKKKGGLAVFNHVALVLAFLVIVLFGVRTIGPGEWWTHLATGRLMAQEGGVPESDHFTFTAQGEPLVAPSWLYDKLVYGVWQVAGMEGASILHVLAVIAAFLLMLPLARRWCGIPGIALSLLLCGWLLSFRFNPSPSLLVLIFPSAFMAMLYGGPKTVYLWTVLPLAQWIWMNMHSSFLLGPLLCMLMAMQVAFSSEDRKTAGAYPAVLYLGVGLFCLGVTFINPYGIGLYKHLVSEWNNPIAIYANEWISPFAAQFENNLPSVLLMLTLFVVAVGLITYRHRLPLMLTVVVALAAFMAVRSMRFIEIMAVLIFPFLCLTMQATLDMLGGGFGKTVKHGRRVECAASILAVGLACFSLWSIVSNDYYRDTGSAVAFGLGTEDSALPAAAGAVIEDDAFPARALNLPLEGGYLAWRFPQRDIFADTRSVLYGADFYKQMNSALYGNSEAWRETVDEYGIDAVIVPCAVDGGGNIVNSVRGRPGWRLAYFDGTTAILLRNREKYASLWDRDIQMAGLELLEKERRSYWQKLEAGKLPPNSPRLIGAGNVFYALGKLDRAYAIYELLLQGAPQMSSAWRKAGTARIKTGNDIERGVRLLETACRQDPDTPLGWLWLSRGYMALDREQSALDAYQRGMELDSDLAAMFGRPVEFR